MTPSKFPSLLPQTPSHPVTYALYPQFPTDWVVQAKGKNGYKITSSPPTHVFTTLKDAKAYLETGALPLKKLKKKKGDPSSSTSAPSPSSKHTSDAQKLEDKYNEKAELVKRTFPDGWAVEFLPPNNYFITSPPPNSLSFMTIDDAKSFIATGNPTNAVKASNLIISDLISKRSIQDIFADPFSLSACLYTYKTITSTNRPSISAAQYKGIEDMFKVISENHLSESFAEDLLHADGEVADSYRSVVSFPVNFQELCKNIKSKR